MPNKKISQFSTLGNPTGNVIFPVVVSGTNYSLALSGLSSYLNYDLLGQTLSGYTLGVNQPITSADTVLSAFENIQAEINAKQDLLVVTDPTNPADVSFINIVPVAPRDINIVAVSSADTQISISATTSGATDSIILDENGLTIESTVDGLTAGLILAEGFGLSYTGTGIFNDNTGFYIKNPEKIYFPISTVTGDTLALLSDIGRINSKHWLANIDKTIASDETVVIAGNYVLSGTNLTLESSNLNLSIGAINFNKYAQIFIGGYLLLIDSNIVNNGEINVGGAIIMSGSSTIIGTGIIT